MDNIEVNISKKRTYSLGVRITNGTNTTIQSSYLECRDGIHVLSSSKTFLSTLVSTNQETTLLCTDSTELVMTDGVISSSYLAFFNKTKRVVMNNLSMPPLPTLMQIYTSEDINISINHDSAYLRVHIVNTTMMFLSNVVFRGRNGNSSSESLVDVSQSGTIHFINATFTGYSCSFCSFEIDSTLTNDAYLIQSVVSLRQSSNIVFKNCLLAENNSTALKAVDSSFIFKGRVTFSNNRGKRGAAIIMSQNSYMTIADTATVTFSGNTARQVGGAIYLDGHRDLITVYYESAYENAEVSPGFPGHVFNKASNWTLDYPLKSPPSSVNSNKLYTNPLGYSHCFLIINSSETNLVFINNSAAWGGDVLYGGNLALECTSHNRTCDESCLVLFKTASAFKPPNSLSLISSDSLRVCLCKLSNIPDCSIIDTSLSAYPGQTINLQVVVVGQDFGAVRGSVFAQFMDLESTEKAPQIVQGQMIQAVSAQQCNQVNYTILVGGI